MNNREKLVFGLAVGLGAFAPFAYAETVTTKTGMKACAKALMTSIKSEESNIPKYVVNPQGSGLNDHIRTSEVIYLDAVVGNNDVVAKANCVVNADAEVQSLEILPNDAPEARRRAF